MKRGRIARLADRRVVDVAVLLEVVRQVLAGVAPALGAGDMDLASSQRAQNGQLVGDSLDFAVLVDDRQAPLLGDDAVDRDLFVGR